MRIAVYAYGADRRQYPSSRDDGCVLHLDRGAVGTGLEVGSGSLYESSLQMYDKLHQRVGEADGIKLPRWNLNHAKLLYMVCWPGQGALTTEQQQAPATGQENLRAPNDGTTLTAQPSVVP